MRINAAVLCATSVSLFASCSDPSSELANRRERAEMVQLAQLKTLLSTNGALDTDFQVFLSNDVLNQALKQIDAVDVPLRELDDAVLTISAVQTAFSNGYPALDLKVTVKSPKRSLNAQAVASAWLFLDVAPGGSINNSTFRVVLKDIAPAVSVGFFDFSLKGFWKDLAALAAQEKISNLPSFSVPLTAQTPFAFGGTSNLTFPTGNGSTVSGVLTVPTISGAASLALKHALFLEDGVHLYLAGDIQ
jgi:hypothetical protein